MNETAYPLAPQRRDRTATSEQKGMQVNDRPRSVQAPSRRTGFVAAATLAALLCMVFVSSASALPVRPFKEVFGSVAQPAFGSVVSLTVDYSTGDVLVVDSEAKTVTRYNADGTPADFPALGDNVIDAKEGPGGKPCAEEPASCDKTPQNEFSFGAPGEVQIAVDDSGGPTDGNIYVTQGSFDLIDIFGSDGTYLGQLTETEGVAFGEPCGVAAGPDGAVYVGDYGEGEIHKFVPSGAVPTNSNFTASFDFPGNPCTVAAGSGPSAGSIFPAQYNGAVYKMDAATGAVEYQVSSSAIVTESVDPATGYLLVAKGDGAAEFDVSGSEEALLAGRFATTDAVRGIAASSSGDNVYVSRATQVEVFGPGLPVPTTIATPATEITGGEARLNGIVNPEGVEIEECFFEWGETTSYGSVVPCEGAIPTDFEDHPVHADISGLESDGVTYHFRLVAVHTNGTERSDDRTFVTARTVVTEPATEVGAESATLNGTVRPEGQQYTSCVFEYGPSTRSAYETSVPCDPAAASIPADSAVHAVSADLTGLAPGATYKFRLVATNAEGTVFGGNLTFETLGPRILVTRARDADQSSATLEARINPKGLATSYHFEWGATTSYGNSTPASPEPIGSGTEPVTVSAEISGLSGAAVYHYRVVAESEIGKTEGADHIVETLNSCGLPDGRCFELVSRRDAGPVALIEPEGGSELAYQAATQSGSLAYNVETGYLDATKGANILYRGTRGPSEWATKQLSAPIIAHDETSQSSSGTSKTLGVSGDLSCNIQESSQPLTNDASTRLVLEAGGANLYRQNPDGSYTSITWLAPENPKGGSGFIGGEYTLLGFTQDCGKVLFSGSYLYPGVANGSGGLYEWDEGTLRGLNSIPGPSGEVAAADAVVGGGVNRTNAFSEDGSRIFLSARRQTSPNPDEIGSLAVFVRENGTVRDLSLSETSTPSGDATYQYASKDGSRVFFTARAGLTDEASSEGTDLYEYDLESEELTDLTATDEAGGAGVAGFIGGSDDGSHVYFIARGQLVPGRGKTFDENKADKTYSVYGVENGEFEYAGLIRESYPRISPQDVHYDEDQMSRVIINRAEFQTSRVSPDGRYLLFESSANVTGYDSGNGITEAFLFDSEADAEPTVCVSCRQDGAPSHSPYNNTRLSVGGFSNPLHQPRSLVVRNGKAQVYFNAFDRLAPGGVDELSNTYEWSHGQVFHIDTEPPGLQENQSEAADTVDSLNSRFMDASEDGTDLYLATPNRLTWEDGDDRTSAFSARVGGGYPEPAAPPAPCNPTGEGSCQATPGIAPTTPAPGSATFTGPANPKPKKAHHKKKHKKKHHKKKSKNKKSKKKNNANRRAGK